MMKTIININHKELSKKQYPDNFNHKYLCCTNILLVIPLFIFLFNKHEINDNSKVEYLLASLLILTIIFSQLFWHNPIKYSNIHKIVCYPSVWFGESVNNDTIDLCPPDWVRIQV